MNWQELVEKCDIYTYISQFVDLEYKNGEYWGLSPFKDERTPSFSVNIEKQVFKDFSSGKSGNIIAFVMNYHKCNFIQALKILKEFFNIQQDIEYIEPPNILKILKQFKPIEKKEKKIERKFLANNCMDKYDKIKIKSWEEEGISPEIIEKYNVRFDSEKETIVFPIWDNNSNIINIKARSMSKHWKELGKPKYYYYYKLGTLDYLWGLNFKRDIIKEKNEIIIFEGEKSVMKMESWGIDNCAALCSGNINDEQLILLLQLSVNVVIALDKDKNYKKDANIKKLSRFCNVEIVSDKFNLLDEKDSPCDKGLEIWKKLYNERKLI